MSDSNSGSSDSRSFDPSEPGEQRPGGEAGKRWLGFLVGCLFGISGLIFLVESVMNFGEMKQPPEVEYHSSTAHRESGYSLSGGFGRGLGSFFGMIFLAVGTGVATASATDSLRIRRCAAAILALTWHGVGIAACWNYCSLAPKLDVWPFLMIVAYGWLGLFPLALAIPEGVMEGRLRSAVWNAMGGGFLGGVAGAIIGGVGGGIAVVASSATEGEVTGTTWWLFAAIGGGLFASISMAVLRLVGWEAISSDKKMETEKDEVSGECQASDILICRKCRMPIGVGVSECPRCGAPAQVNRERAIGHFLTGVGLVCAIGTWFGMGAVQSWLVRQGIHPVVLRYLFWLIFAGGWVMIGIGSLLSSAGQKRSSEIEPPESQ